MQLVNIFLNKIVEIAFICKEYFSKSKVHTEVFLPPANEVCEGYVFTPVCHSVHRGECLGPGPGGRLGGLAGGGGGPGPHPGGVSRPRPGGVQAQAQGWCPGQGPGECIPACTEADTPLQQTATAAGGTHPTGMHSCLLILIADKKLYACKTAIDDFKTILNTIGGPQEHIRANELLQEIIIVEDQPSSRAIALQSSAKIKDRGKV